MQKMLGGLLFLAICAAMYVAAATVPLVFATLTWLALGPMVRMLLRWGVPAPASSAALTGALFVLIVLAGHMATGPISEWMRDLPATTARLQWKLRELRAPVNAASEAAKSVEEVSGGLNGDKTRAVIVEDGGMVGALMSNLQWVLSTAAASMVLLYFLLASGTYFHARLIASFDHLGDKKKALRIALDIERDVVLSWHHCPDQSDAGPIVAVVLFAAGMPMAWSWGVTAAVLNFMPISGR
ncbi:MAG: hypothetical protein R3E83_15370 [Burkholderiaceae bacterium]